jgi:hypothetical protein
VILRRNLPWRPAPSRDEGATVVEFAFSSAVLLSLVFGVIVVSMAVYTYHFVCYSARIGTRYAIVRGSTCLTTVPGCPGFGNGVDVQTYLQSLPFPGIVSSSLTATTTWTAGGVPCSPSVNPCDNPGNMVKVTVDYQFPFNIPFVPSTTLALHSTSQMVIAQ